MPADRPLEETASGSHTSPSHAPGVPPIRLDEPPSLDLELGWTTRVRHRLVGRPRDLADRRIFHHISLIPFLAWVGLGADGLSSSAYGPDEAFRTLFTATGSHTYLAVALAFMTAITVLIIASAYRHIIESFPHGGGGYVVATKLLGERVGVTSGCALLVDYMLTITVSIAAAGDALFSMLPPNSEIQKFKVVLEVVLIILLVTLNIRGVKESVLVLTPIFLLFLLTHIILIGGGIFAHIPEVPMVAKTVTHGFHEGLGQLGKMGLLLMLVRAFSMGGGTYTGLEAVSNGLPIMREPKVKTGQRTMLYMAISLAFTAGGLLICYLLWNVQVEPHKTLNAVLVERFAGQHWGGGVFVFLTLLSEGALLFVGAQAGFIDGPRILGNMAVDSWAPRRFAALSDRLTTQNGIILMGVASLSALIYTGGDVRALVVMYSINVFLTFSLSMFAMLRMWVRERGKQAVWLRRSILFGVGFVVCATILTVTILEKFREGGWLTLLVTASFVVLCLVIRSHYTKVAEQFTRLNQDLAVIERITMPSPAVTQACDTTKPTAAILVGGYSGLGIHTIMAIHRAFPGHFKNIVFLTIAVIDSGKFKGEDEVQALRENTEAALKKYENLARKLGFCATSKLAIGTEVVDEAEKLCVETAKEFSQTVFFTGKVIFQRERWYHKLLHNQTAFAIQKRLQWDGLTMVVMPVRVRQMPSSAPLARERLLSRE